MNEQALKARLRHIAKEENSTFQDVWRRLILERFLVLVSKSKFSESLIFKGGLLLSHYLEIGRQTKDIDFLARSLEANIESIEECFTEICHSKSNDGFWFNFESIQVLDQEHMNYPGYRVNLETRFSNMKDKIQIDIGVGDDVDPKLESLDLFQYKGQAIFEGAISLKVYPVESIFAEKLETAITRGHQNSRMKDYHDMLLMSRSSEILDIDILNSAIVRTIANRGSTLSLPLKFVGDDLQTLEKLWSSHLRRLGKVASDLKLPARFSEVLKELNAWLSIHLKKSRGEN